LNLLESKISEKEENYCHNLKDSPSLRRPAFHSIAHYRSSVGYQQYEASPVLALATHDQFIVEFYVERQSFGSGSVKQNGLYP
jgi:hypothetical protein